MNSLPIRDFRGERYVRLMRAWVVLHLLSENAKFADGVPLPKAAFVDFLLCNPSAQHKFLEHFGRAQKLLKIDDFLYNDNVEFGSLQDHAEFSSACIELINATHVTFEKIDGDIVLHCPLAPDLAKSDLIDRWAAEIRQIMPLLGKSVNILHASILSI